MVDLGNVALIPRLVNAHTHLEFSDCDSPIGTPGIELADWIGQVIAARGQADDESRTHAIAAGIEESARAGVGLIGDIATTPCRYPAGFALTEDDGRSPSLPSPKLVSFAEAIGLSPQRADQRYAAALAHQATLSSAHASSLEQPLGFGISPHAPYSTRPDLIDRCVRLSRQCQAPLAMHVAESRHERSLLQSASGRFADVLQAAGLWQEGLFPWPHAEPVESLIEQLSGAHRALLVHGNDFTDREITQLARHPHLSVVYCPRTHHFFGHRPHPVDRLLHAGVRVALGTDSRASNPDLSIWREVQHLLRHRPDLAPHRVLEMATRFGGEALLGDSTKYGTIQVNRSTPDDVVAVASDASTTDRVWCDFAEQELLCSKDLWRT